MSQSTHTRHRVAAIQMVSSTSVEKNLASAAQLIADAAAQGAHLVVLPEYFCLLGMHDTDKIALREALDHGPIQSFLRTMAIEHGIWLIGGTVPLVAPEPDKVLNTSLVFNPNGQRVAHYDKIHLFSFNKTSQIAGETRNESYHEAQTITPGSQPVSFAAPFGRVGLSICYDLRFPELYRALDDMVLMVVPAAFTTTTGRAHWEVLLRARAIENQCYLLAAAQGGQHENGRSTYGHSMFIDPWGEIKSVLDQGSGVVIGDIDLDFLAMVRRNLPALSHRVLKSS